MNIIDKIKKLLNQTVENGCTPEEAKTSFALARKLMIKYKLNEKDIKDSNENDIVKLELSYDCNTSWIYSLIQVFITNFSVMHFMIRRNNELHCVLFGTNIDVDCVKTLIRCAYNYLMTSSEHYFDEYQELFGVANEDIKLSYNKGFISGLSDKYADQNKHLNKEEALMIVPNKKVKEEFNKFTKDFEKENIEVRDIDNKEFIAIRAGYSAGRKFGTTALSGGTI